MFLRHTRIGGFPGLVGLCVSLPFTSLVLMHGTDLSFLSPFFVVCLRYGERS